MHTITSAQIPALSASNPSRTFQVRVENVQQKPTKQWTGTLTAKVGDDTASAPVAGEITYAPQTPVVTVEADPDVTVVVTGYLQTADPTVWLVNLKATLNA